MIIPLFNGARWIREALESVYSQTLPPAEVVVVDDGSTDEGPSVVASFKGARLLRNPEKGANSARVFGLRNVASPFVALLDQDDCWHPEHLAHICAAFDADPGCPAVAAKRSGFRDRPEFPERMEPGVTEIDPWGVFPSNGKLTPSCVVIRQEALRESGGWETRFPGVADFSCWLRLSARRPLARSLAQTAARRLHADSLSRAHRNEPRAYMDAHLGAIEDALTYRPAAPETEGAVAWLGMMRALHGSDLAEFREGARQFEKSASGMPRESLGRYFQFPCKFLYGGVAPEIRSWQRTVLRWLIEEIPAEAPAIRAAIRRQGIRYFPLPVLRDCQRQTPWSLALARMRLRIWIAKYGEGR